MICLIQIGLQIKGVKIFDIKVKKTSSFEEVFLII